MSSKVYLTQKANRLKWISQGICIECHKPTDRLGKNRCTACLIHYAKWQKPYLIKYRDQLREAAFDHYGHTCQCCGEKEKTFLCFDHMNNDGGQQRKKDIYATNLPSWLKKYQYPKEFQTLCHNCNHAKAVYSVCPHKWEPGVIYVKALLRPGIPREHIKGGNGNDQYGRPRKKKVVDPDGLEPST